MTGFEGQLPEWAIALRHGEIPVGVQLCTKDGRRVGNGFLMHIWDSELFPLYIVLTDMGNTMQLTLEELNEYYHVGMYVCSLQRIQQDITQKVIHGSNHQT